MSAALEKSLDDIISSSRKAKKVANKKKVVGKTTAKTAGKVSGKGTGKAQKKTAPASKNGRSNQTALSKKIVVPSLDLSHATKVVAHGLPTDLKHDVVKVC